MYNRYCLLRDEKGYVDADVARMANITKSTFSDWKSGKSKPNAEKLLAISQCLETTVEFLMTGKDSDYVIEMAETDVALSNMSKRMKEYALKLSAMSEEKQKHVMDLIDLLENKNEENI